MSLKSVLSAARSHGSGTSIVRSGRNQVTAANGVSSSSPAVVALPPEDDVRVEKKLHSDGRLKASSTCDGNGASKSAAIQILPFRCSAETAWSR